MLLHRRTTCGPFWLLLFICGLPTLAAGKDLRPSDRSVDTERVQAEATDSARQAMLMALVEGRVPDSLAELIAMEEYVQAVAKQVIPATVAVQVDQSHGSGVIINSTGYVLTAAHVAGKANRSAWLRMHDGRRVTGITMGVFRTLDAGLIKITEQPTESGGWPHAEIGFSQELAEGAWCVATGHPGGFQEGRLPIVRTGRVLRNEEKAIRTDCKLIGGDSGGPLFDMRGQVIGIHSRIGNEKTVNLHVPISTYRNEDVWSRMVAGESWGQLPGSGPPRIGVQGHKGDTVARIGKVFADTPAERAGIQPGDIITKFADRTVTDFDSLIRLVQEQQPGDRVLVEILRGNRTLRRGLTVGEDKKPEGDRQ
jgi:serine protease Do